VAEGQHPARGEDARDRAPDAEPAPGELARRVEVGELVGRLSDEELTTRQRSRALAELTRLLGGAVRAAGAGALVSGRLLTDLVQQVAPHLSVRDLETLSAHHDGLVGEQLAEQLVRAASRSTAAIGAAGGALTALQSAAPPTLLAMPVELLAETLAIVSVELRLTAELHVAFGRAPLAPMPQVASAYLTSWASRRAVDPAAGVTLGTVLGVAARQQLRRRLTRRLARNLSMLAPLLAGAVAGAELNRRETRSLGAALIEDLRGPPR